jgi:hypothetical protein
MAKKTLLSENQVSSFMKLANINQDKIKNFLGSTKKMLKENDGMQGTYGNFEEDEPAADMSAETEGDNMGTGADLEPAPPEETVETEGGELAQLIAQAVADGLKMAGIGSGEESMEMDMGSDADSEMDFESDEMTDTGMESEEEGQEEEAEYDEEEEEEEEDEMEEEEEEELQEAKKLKATKKARSTRGGDQKPMKESLAFGNVDLVTDDEIINEVLKRVIRRLI